MLKYINGPHFRRTQESPADVVLVVVPKRVFRMCRVIWALSALLVFLVSDAGVAAQTQTDAALAGPVVLTVTATDKSIALNLEELRAMPVTSFETTTIWTEGVQQFQGVLLADVLRILDLSGTSVTAMAINDYMVSIPASDATADGPMIAYTRNGKVMHRRGKGPLWLVYPFDSNVEYQTQTIHARAIWQLDRLSIE